MASKGVSKDPRAGGGRATSVVDRFGFSWPWLFYGENPDSKLLDYLGFPWILSSELRLFNGLHGIFERNFFLALSPSAAASRGTKTAIEAMRKRRIAHELSVNEFQIIRNKLSC
jgi:hypothetical protein